MTDERLRLSIPDDQVCATCQAVVLDMTAHQQWHTRLAEHIAQRIAGVERHIRANAQQAADLITMEQRNRDVAVDGLHAGINRLDEWIEHVQARVQRHDERLTRLDDEPDIVLAALAGDDQ